MSLFVNNIQWIVVALGNKLQDIVSDNWWVRGSVLNFGLTHSITLWHNLANLSNVFNHKGMGIMDCQVTET